MYEDHASALFAFLLNFRRSPQAVARNQTFVNEALFACALERFRKATANYPETLEALVPCFLDRLPHEID